MKRVYFVVIALLVLLVVANKFCTAATQVATNEVVATLEPKNDIWWEMPQMPKSSLCWQTDNGRQNDAVMYGAMLAYRYKRVMIDTTFGGYAGWERVGDRPMTLKTNLSYHIDNLSLRVGYQVGFNDWPYHQIRIGASYSFDVLSKK